MSNSGATKRVIVGFRKVRCPYDGSWIEVRANINDYISYQCERGNLLEVHRETATRFSRILERAMSHGLTVASFAQERVDTSGFQTDIKDSVIEAQKELALLASYLGRRQFHLLQSVIMDGLSASALSSAVMGERSPYNRHEVSGRIREALDDAAKFFGLAMKDGEARRWARVVSVASEYPRDMPKPDDEP